MDEKRKVLLIEDREYYEKLGVLDDFNIEKYDIEFNGMKKYKMNDDQMASYFAVISFLYTSPAANLLILKAKKNGVKTILLSDGIIDWTNLFNNPMQLKYKLKLYHPILHDIFLCVGEDEKEYFESLGNNVIKFMPSRIINTDKKIPLPNKTKVLITTANTAYFDNIEKELLVKLISDTCIELERLNIRFAYRIFDDYLVRRLNIKECENIISGSFESTLEDVSSVITTPSSISINAMYHDRSVGHFLYRDAPIFVQSGWIVSKSFPISNTLLSIVSRDEERMVFQRYQVKKYLENEDPKTNILEKGLEYAYETKRINEYIDKNLYNLLNSRFNINIEYFFRKQYLRFKKNKVFNKLLATLRKKIK